MRPRGVFAVVGLAAAVLGVGVFLGLILGGCGTAQTTGAAPAGPQSAQTTLTAVQPRLPALDLQAPSNFQTATFSFG